MREPLHHDKQPEAGTNPQGMAKPAQSWGTTGSQAQSPSETGAKHDRTDRRKCGARSELRYQVEIFSSTTLRDSAPAHGRK
eukprot:12822796-Alexandrium_andersonii.AAC.1